MKNFDMAGEPGTSLASLASTDMRKQPEEFCSRNARILQRLTSKLKELAEDPYNRRPLSAAAKAAETLEEEAVRDGLTRFAGVAAAMYRTLDSCNKGLNELNPRHLQVLSEGLGWLRRCMEAVQESNSEIALPKQDWWADLQEPASLAPSQTLPPSPAGQPAASLNDVAAMLVQIDPDDLSRLGRIQEGLRIMVASQPGSSQAAAMLQTALEKLKQASESDSTQERENLLSEAGLYIDAASDTMEAAPGSSPIDVQAEVQSRPLFVQLPEDVDLELMAEFVIESSEAIDAAEASLLDLETSPQDTEAINTVFRSFHTIKGTAAFLGLDVISHLAHRAENLLSRIREQEVVFAGGYADLALRSVDILKELLQAVQDSLGGQSTPVRDAYHDLIKLLENPEAHGISDESSDDERPQARLGDILVDQGKADRHEVEAVASCKGNVPLGRALVKSGTAKVSDVAHALRSQKRSASPDSSVRVKTEKLDRMIDMVGELVIAHSIVAQDELVGDRSNFETTRKVNHVGKIVRDLQDLCLSLRMIPMQAVFQKLARLVRDLSRKTGKQLEFTSQGEETEIDRNMVDIIGDPLVHMVRNAVDHGIEMPEVRLAAGKPAAGRVSLRACHEGSNIIVELKDDGKGLDRDKIAAKAVAKQLIESAQGLSDREVFDLIFAAGFSTAREVTDMSGRGVGMDVVKRSIGSLRGRVEISSRPGQGCTFRIVLPLTLAITDGMLVRVGPERFIIPAVNIQKSFRPQPDSLSSFGSRGEMVLLDDESMPICRLQQLFEIEGAAQDPAQGILIVVGDSRKRYALLVDELLGQQQVVAKSLGGSLGPVEGISGAAILGDGRVGLILDAAGLMELAERSAKNAISSNLVRVISNGQATEYR